MKNIHNETCHFFVHISNYYSDLVCSVDNPRVYNKFLTIIKNTSNYKR